MRLRGALERAEAILERDERLPDAGARRGLPQLLPSEADDRLMSATQTTREVSSNYRLDQGHDLIARNPLDIL